MQWGAIALLSDTIILPSISFCASSHGGCNFCATEAFQGGAAGLEVDFQIHRHKYDWGLMWTMQLTFEDDNKGLVNSAC